MASLRLARLAALLTLAFAVSRATAVRAEDQDIDAIGDDAADDDDDDNADPQEETKKDEADRAWVAGKGEGALGAPIAIRDEARAAKLCDALQGERNAKPDANLEQLEVAKHSALRDVYTILLAPGGFKIGEYRPRAGRLPLRLEHPLTAFEGALRMIVTQKAGGAFSIPAKEASAIVSAIDDKKLGLEVVFRVDSDMAESMTPCFSYPKSAAYALNIEPLSFTLVDVGSNNRKRAEAKTPALDKLKEWMDPGKARLSIAATAEGALDSEVFAKVIEAKRGELEACFGTMIQSVSATGMVSYEASVTPQGSVTDIRLEAESLDDDQVGACAAKVIAAVGAPRAAKGSKAHVALSIERGEESAQVVND